MECLGPTTGKHKDCFDENSKEIIQLLEDKGCAYRAHLHDLKSTAKIDVLRNICSTIQLKLCQMQDSWLSNKADEIPGFADRNDMKNFYNSMKEVYGPTTSGSSPLLSADGSTLITDKEKILERWVEHFDSILNCPFTINNEAINWLPQVSFDEMLDAVPTFEEIWKAIHLLTSGKAPGADSIPTEVYKEGGTALTEKLHQLFQLIWQHETVPKDFKDASIIHLYNARETDRPVTIIVESPCSLSQARSWPEFYSTTSLYILREASYQRSQCGFQKECRTINMVFADRQLQDKCQE